MENMFETNPIQVVIYDPANSMPITTFLFVGNIPKNILSEIKSAIDSKSHKNYVLEQFYGKNWSYKIGLTKTELKFGGNDDTDIFDISEITGIPKISVTIPKHQSPTTNAEIIVISDYFIYPDDRITEFKYKLYAATNKYYTTVPIHYQHIFCSNSIRIIPMLYQIEIDNPVTVNIIDSYQNIKKSGNIMGFPIDHNIYPAKNMIRITSNDHTQTLGDIYRNTGTTVFYLVDFNSVISQHIPILRELLKTDRIQIELLYYSFIIKFWPAITLELFEMIITNTDISKTYPDLYPSISKLDYQLHRESEILNTKYTLIKKDIGKYCFDPSKITSQSLITCSIKSATLSIQTLIPVVLNPRDLFETFNLTEQVPIIKMRINVAGTETVITKIKESIPDIQSLYNTCKYKMQLLSTNSILLVVRTSKILDQFLVIVIRSNGNYMVRSIWNNATDITFDNIRLYIQKNVNPIIAQLNDMSRSIFSTQNNLPEITIGNSQFSELNIDIIWKKSLTDSNFEILKKEINEDIENRILKIKSEDSPEVFNANVIIFNAYKSICNIDPNIISVRYKIPNYYYYLIEAKSKQHWQSVFDSGKQVILTRRTTDVKFEVNDFRESEFIYFYTYLSTRLYLIKTKFGKEASNIVHKPTKTNNLKILKERDPELFKFKIDNSNMVYSRLVQKSHQPVMYMPNEYDTLPEKIKESAVKYWNFTTQSPVYYHCPNPKNPYLNFITDYHPKKYCLPKCCKVRAIMDTKEKKYNSKYVRDPVVSKKYNIYNTCIQNHIFNTESSDLIKSRYIMNYKKTLDYNRISYLPDIVTNYFMYNSSEQLVAQARNFISYSITNDPPKIYSVRELWRSTKSNKIYSVPISEFMSDLLTKSWSYQSEDAPDFSPMDIIKNPNLSSTHYSRILNSDIKFPILVYKHVIKDQKKVLDGLHRLANRYIEYKRTKKDMYIQVRYVTNNQLRKSEVLSDDKEVDEYYQQSYYMYGSSQNLPAISFTGAIFALADAISMSVENFIISCVNSLKKNTGIDYFKCLLNGVLLKYFTDIGDLLSAMNELIISKKPIEITHPFNLWNELFIDIVKYCFGITVIVIKDNTLDNTGADIQLIINSKIQNVSDIIPDYRDKLEITKQFIVLIKKIHRTMSSEFEYTYYPVFKLIPKEFFKTNSFLTKIHTQDDTIIKILRQLLDRTLNTNKINELNLTVLLKFINTNKSYKITGLYVTKSNMCYAVKIKGATDLVISISYSTYSDLILISDKQIRTDINIIREPMLRKNIHQSYTDLYNFIVLYNEFVISESKANLKFDIDNSDNISLVFPLLKIDNILTLVRSNTIIGMTCNSMRYYFEPVNNNKNELTQFIKTMNKSKLFRYELTAEYAKSLIMYLRYDPDTVNLAIYEYVNTYVSTPIKLLPLAVYERHKYQNFCLTIFHKLDQETNSKLRTKIETLIHDTKFNDYTSHQEFNSKLAQLVDIVDAETIKLLVLDYLNSHFNKKTLITNFSNIKYQFDKKTLNKLKYYSDRDTYSLEKMREIVVALCEPLFHIGTIQLDDNINSEPCYLLNKKSGYCKDSKMILDSESLNNLISIFIADLCNPLKRQYLLSAVYNRYLNSDLRFEKNHDEQIYIRV